MGKKGGGMIGNQVFAFTNANQIMSDNNCLDVSDKKGNFTIFYFKDMYFQVPCLGPVKLIRCHGLGGNQAWR